MRLTVAPDPHQERAIYFLSSRPRSILAFATGTGKSYCQLASALMLFRQGKIDKFLMVGTVNSIIELSNDCRTFLDHEPIFVQNANELFSFLQDKNAQIAVMKYGAIDIEEATQLQYWFSSTRIAVSFDEFHKLKNPETTVSQTYAKIMDYFDFCFGATATPITAKLEDLYFLINCLSPSYLGTYDQFNLNYVDRILQTIYLGRGRKKKVWKIKGYRNLKILQQWMDQIIVSFYPEYDFRNETISGELDNFPRYMDAVSGFLKSKKSASIELSEEDEDTDEPKKKTHSARIVDAQHAVNADPAKLTLFRETVKKKKDIGVLVYCTHYETLELLTGVVEEEGIEYQQITGKMTQKKREEAKKWFNSSPNDKVLFITLGGGQSLNLQATNRLILYDIPFGIGHYIQVLGRVARYFSKFKFFEITYIVMKDTIDEYKFHYIQHNAEPLIAVLGNKVGAWEDLPPYNEYLLSKLRQQLIWKK